MTEKDMREEMIARMILNTTGGTENIPVTITREEVLIPDLTRMMAQVIIIINNYKFNK